MPVGVVENISRNKDVLHSFIPLYWFLKVFALDTTKRKNGVLQHSCSFVRATTTVLLLTAIDFFSLFCKTKYVFNDLDVTVKLTDTIHMIFDGVHFVIDVAIVYKFGKRYCTEYYINYERIDSILGLTDNSQTRSEIVKLLSIFVVTWSVGSAYDFVAWCFSYEVKIPLIYSIAYIYLAIQMLQMLDLTAHVIHIENRLLIIGDMVQDHYHNADHHVECSQILGDVVASKNWFYHSGTCRLKKNLIVDGVLALKKHSISQNHEVKWLSKCYLMLTEQAHFVDQLHGLRTILNCISLIFDIVRFTNMGVRLIIGTQHTQFDSGFWPVFTCIIRVFTCLFILVVVVRQCERVYQQCYRIVCITDHLLINKNSGALRSSLTELRELVMSRPIHFHAANFFTLNYSFLVSIASASVTYTIILLQSN